MKGIRTNGKGPFFLVRIHPPHMREAYLGPSNPTVKLIMERHKGYLRPGSMRKASQATRQEKAGDPIPSELCSPDPEASDQSYLVPFAGQFPSEARLGPDRRSAVAFGHGVLDKSGVNQDRRAETRHAYTS